MSSSIERVICLVADGLGVGAAPDANTYGDDGANTLGHVASAVGGLKLPTLQRLGLGNIGNFAGIPSNPHPEGYVGRMAEKSAGKDTTTGHWEIAGLVTKKAFALYPEGFPEAMVQKFITEAQIPGVLGNYASSGTTIIDALGEEHIKTGKPILYTSGDSVFQIAANETTFGLERLYKICEVARKLTEPFQIGRVIARPFIGSRVGDFKRTEHRRDYSLPVPQNCLDVLQASSVPVYSVGKIDDIFGHRGITCGNHTGNNPDSLNASLDFMKKCRGERGLVFTNLVDFDQLYGHRRDAEGYARSLVQLDTYLPKIIAEMTERDALIITADHGCDPTFRGTDHTREYVPLVVYSPKKAGGLLGDRSSFTDIAAFLLEAYGISPDRLPDAGSSFLCNLKS